TQFLFFFFFLIFQFSIFLLTDFAEQPRHEDIRTKPHQGKSPDVADYMLSERILIILYPIVLKVYGLNS
ncbi:hypothetical protein, partial [Candidatus Symbiothrix dinenymphae]|uniref:hypothetical protein n=1 Tax=Candidatus Symbiothrix dinenymphae TaxID=467085 RepID=UPI001D041CFD